MAKRKKNPWIAAVLNFLLYGLGYIYNGKRLLFGAGLVIFGIVYFAVLMMLNLPEAVWDWITIFGFIFALLFAYDGFQESKELNRRK